MTRMEMAVDEAGDVKLGPFSLFSFRPRSFFYKCLSIVFRDLRLSITFVSPFLSLRVPFPSLSGMIYLSSFLVCVVWSCYCHTVSL